MRITISDGTTEQVLNERTIAELQGHVDRTNNAMRGNFSVVEWIHLHLCEIAISEELAAAIRVVTERQEATAKERLETAIRRKRDQLLEDLDPSLTP